MAIYKIDSGRYAGRYILADWNEQHAQYQGHSPAGAASTQGYQYSYARSLDALATLGVTTYKTRDAACAARDAAPCEDEPEEDAVWEAADWLAGHGSPRGQCDALGILADTTQDDLDATEVRLIAEATRDGVTLDGLADHLERLRAHARGDA